MGLLTAKPSSAKIKEGDPWFLDVDERPDWQTQFGNRQPIKLEIGFGMGDFLIEMATREPYHNFIGIDFYHKGIQKLINRIRNLGLNNIRVVHGDVRNKIPLLFQDGTLDTIYINFPDPWPKKRHKKRRLIKPELVMLLAQKLAPMGRVCLATDSGTYAREILEYFNACSLFQNMERKSGFLEDRGDLPKTKFEKSFIYAGDKIHYLEYFRLTDDRKTEKSKKIPLAEEKTNESKESGSKVEINDKLRFEKLKNAESNAKDACDLKKVADGLADAGSKEWAKKVYRKATDQAQDSLDFNWLAYSISELLDDKDWAREIYKQAEDKAENGLDFNWLAYSISETLGDKDWAKKLYKKAEGRTENVRELCDLADSISETLGDKDWIEEIYKQAEDKAEEYSDFYELANNLYEKLANKQWARALSKEIEDRAEDSSDFHSLGEYLCARLGDEEWAKRVYGKAESKAKDSDDFCGLADSLCEIFGDEEWAIRLYKKAENKAEKSCEFRNLGSSLYKNLGDKEWARKLYKKAEDQAEVFYEFRWLVECLYKNLGDKEWAKKVYKKAANRAKDPSDFNRLTNSVYENLGSSLKGEQ
jgi:tRNA (guanine-N7-)-methyltransferase